MTDAAQHRPDDWPFLPSGVPRIVDGDGAWLIADDGRRILDAAGGAIVANVGHGRAEVAEAIAKASAGPSYVVPTWRTPQREAMAARLREHWLPANLHHIMATGSGSDGVEAAVKIALQHFAAQGMTARTKIVSRELSYHGTTIAMAGLSGHRARKRGLENFLQIFPAAPTPYPLRSPLGRHHPQSGAHYLAATRALIEAEGPDTIAAFVMEPVVGASGGAIVPPADYVAGIRALCDEFGILLIVDEVMTGFGRTGAKLGVDHWNLRADLLVGGKGLAGGYAPLCGVFADPRVAAPIAAAGMDVMFHTFGAHPAACAAADAVLTILQRENLVERARVLGERLSLALHATLGNHPHVAEIRGLGLLQAVELVRDRDTLEQFDIDERVTTRVVQQGLEHGVFFYPGGTGAARDIIVFGPPFVASEGEIDQMAEVLAQSIKDVLC
ncbi:MAG TPA: aminotransferase class III-fold pyridoxal phosphate-dependent enzyme [Caulobacteraceae bacterium]|jgi:adenosylmethionine-8-amino-7-oxononanoate aminotransferase|nr:aminotransferase class III-fold pyridoxal phosphate-dependent enzyme [Caulobacteraceae bacterium]